MRIWKAIDEHGHNICTVTTTQNNNESDMDFLNRARTNVKEQLARPGRRAFYDSWVRGGERLVSGW